MSKISYLLISSIEIDLGIAQVCRIKKLKDDIHLYMHTVTFICLYKHVRYEVILFTHTHTHTHYTTLGRVCILKKK